MPIYEYHCEPCNHSFETLVRGVGDAPHCPKCNGIDLHKLLSVPAAAHTSAGSKGSDLPMCEAEGGSPYACGGGECGSGLCGMD